VSSTPLRCAAAAAAGVVAALAFPPADLPFLLPPAVAAFLLAVPRAAQAGWRAAALVGLGFGLSFMALHVGWIHVIGIDVAVGLVLLQAAFYTLLGAGVRLVRDLPAWPVWAAAVWVAVDTVRGSLPWGGFPWGGLAFATVDTPLAPAVSVVGTAGTTFLAALTGAVLAWAVLQLPTRRAVALGGVTALVLGVALTSAMAARTPWADDGDEGATVRVAAVQGDVPGEGMDAFSERRAVLDNHVDETHRLADRVRAGSTPRPDFVLWPENSTDIDPFRDPTVYSDIQGAVDAVGVPVLVGGMISGDEPEDVQNQSIVWLPGQGPVDHYSKRHPVPFGEYIPMRDLLAGYIERLDQIPRDMVPGTEAGNLELGGADLGVVICFEVAYDGLVRDVVRGGAEMLVVPTNNATYMGTGQVEQQFAISRLRALETDRHVAVVATNGISGLVGPDGTVVERLPVRESGVWEASITLSGSTTPAARWAPVVRWVLVLLALAVVTAGGVLHRRRPAATSAAVRRPQVSSVPDRGEGR
jgi:apolipoprotein N-acyltransferase